MPAPDFKPLPPTTEGRSRQERSHAAESVKALLASDGWREVEAELDSRLRYEQRMAMAARAGASGEAEYERMIGTWAGMRKVRKLAEGIVADGETAEAEMRKVA